VAVVVHDVLERVEPAVVHTRRTERDLAQREYFELAHIAGEVRHAAVVEVIRVGRVQAIVRGGLRDEALALVTDDAVEPDAIVVAASSVTTDGMEVVSRFIWDLGVVFIRSKQACGIPIRAFACKGGAR
jgi:hypothetical protein